MSFVPIIAEFDLPRIMNVQKINSLLILLFLVCIASNTRAGEISGSGEPDDVTVISECCDAFKIEGGTYPKKNRGNKNSRADQTWRFKKGHRDH